MLTLGEVIDLLNFPTLDGEHRQRAEPFYNHLKHLPRESIGMASMYVLHIGRYERVFQGYEDLNDNVRPSRQGPWNEELDYLQWRHFMNPYTFAIHRNHVGSWCGYLGINVGSTEHLLFTNHFREHLLAELTGEVPVENSIQSALNTFHVHGGVTYQRRDFQEDRERNPSTEPVPHFLELPFTTQGYWIGFDCAHGGDLMPNMPGILGEHGHYRTQEYVVSELYHLSRQVRLFEQEYCRQIRQFQRETHE